MADQTSRRPERRKHLRTPALWTGSLVCDNRVVDAIVVNVSANGAKVRVSEPFVEPRSLTLRIPHLGYFHGGLAWRRGDTIGLRFREDAKAPPAGPGTVLFVEDEDGVRLFGARALRNKGYKVLEATNGEEAMELILKDCERIDLLITDAVMPNLDGPALITKLRAIRPNLKVICISGYPEADFRDRLDRSADIRFLPKPFCFQQLAGEVRVVMEAEPADAGPGTPETDRG